MCGVHLKRKMLKKFCMKLITVIFIDNLVHSSIAVAIYPGFQIEFIIISVGF
jgi:hypothetical protein